MYCHQVTPEGRFSIIAHLTEEFTAVRLVFGVITQGPGGRPAHAGFLPSSRHNGQYMRMPPTVGVGHSGLE